jgi:hypothetical protein
MMMVGWLDLSNAVQAATQQYRITKKSCRKGKKKKELKSKIPVSAKRSFVVKRTGSKGILLPGSTTSVCVELSVTASS